MTRAPRPVVRFAFFCLGANRNAKGFLDVTSVFRTLLSVPDKDKGVSIDLVYGVDVPLPGTTMLALTAVSPTGRRIEYDPESLDVGPTGFRDQVWRLRDLRIPEVGEYAMEFRFDGEKTPSYETRFRVGGSQVGMSQEQRPQVRFAFFCGEVTRNADGLPDATHLFRTLPRIPDKNTRVKIAMVFGVDGSPGTTTSLALRLVTPSGHPTELGVARLDLRTGFHDQEVELRGMPIREIGEYSMEFRFDGEAEPSHVALLRATGPEVGMSQEIH